MNELKLRARLANWGEHIELVVFGINENGERCVASNIDYKASNIADSPMPSFDIDKGAAQALMDDLWQAGLRPSEGSGSAGSLLATQKHLEDMRKIVFDQLSTKN